jgi:hypothetical protein
MKRLLVLFVVVASLAGNAWLAWRLWTGSGATRTAQSSGERIVMRTPGGLLEVSTVTAEERFDSSTEHTVLGVPVGRTVASVRVPTVYRYHVPLASEWTIRQGGDALIVVAPKVRPTLPVAIDTGRMEAFSAGVWSPFTGEAAVAALRRSISERLEKKAGSPELLLLQRESARHTVTEFVRKWVLEQPRWQGATAPKVFVFFEDEPLGREAGPLLERMP